MLKRLIALLTGSFLLGCLAAAEPPPRDQRAPTSSSPSQRPPFWDTGWQPSYRVPAGWQARYFHYETKYEVLQTDDGLVFSTYADGTASWIGRALFAQLDPDAPLCLNWSWSADELPTLTEPEDSLAGDDFAIRLYVFGALENGRNFGFNYVWSNDHPRGAVWTSPWSSNRLMSLQQGPNPGGEMRQESRNLIADILHATGERPVQLHSIAIMSDAEGSDSVARARITPVTFSECKPLIS